MTSNRVIALCVIALLAFQGYAVLAFIFMEKWGISVLAVALVVYLALVGGWLWALLVAARGNRRGLIAVAVFSLFPAAHNTTINRFTAEFITAPAEIGFLITEGVVVAAAVLVLVFTRGRLSYTPNQEMDERRN
jgi:hypothetical protein